ncbi:glutathione S-transferase family protein [Mangrovitalea sediminis]|uniref:glutathione S-transferase family protein n=1 Tax=Mangrovitalea sediminis TaxID=1982043 RepID=UPI000BE4FD5E|nr:glutathione S-transferase family protein [Mangrovitalea sediminis]
MGLLVKGQWQDRWYDTENTGGVFIREDSQFRDWITPGGEPGPEGQAALPAASGRFHLYVSLACPWAHRTLIFRKLKGLESHLSVSFVHPHMLENGWEFRPDAAVHRDDVNQARYLHQIYTATDADYSGRVTVPVLWDRETRRIVNNESSDIIRILNTAFSGLGARDYDFYPQDLRGDIDAWNAEIYPKVNNGVYRAGFATTQDAYEEAYKALFEMLDRLESHLGRQRYLVGNRLTEADWRLFTTLIRFDAVYFSHFKCNRQRLTDFPHLSGYLRDLFQVPGVAETVDVGEIKSHYYYSQRTVNPTGIVPVGPLLDFTQPHGRAALGPDSF